MDSSEKNSEPDDGAKHRAGRTTPAEAKQPLLAHPISDGYMFVFG
jgi:hypothetical protein